jgi:hypothetical protein
MPPRSGSEPQGGRGHHADDRGSGFVPANTTAPEQLNAATVDGSIVQTRAWAPDKVIATYPSAAAGEHKVVIYDHHGRPSNEEKFTVV